MNSLNGLRERIRVYRDQLAAMSLLKSAVIVLLALGMIMIGVASYVRSRPRENEVEERGTTEREGSSISSKVYVHVAGAVGSPGVYCLEEGDRVMDAVEAAGGPGPDADLEVLNLARRLEDGEQIVVARIQGEVVNATAGPASGAESGGSARVNINRAESDELESLPGVGPVLAERIIRYREENGPFATVEELEEVDGIGKSKLEDLKDLVTTG